MRLAEMHRRLVRSYIFHERGPIEAPYGMPWPRFYKKQISRSVSDVKFIGMLQSRDPDNENLHSIVLYLRNGDIIRLTSGDYRFEFAHKVAKSLTNALEALRAPRTTRVTRIVERRFSP